MPTGFVLVVAVLVAIGIVLAYRRGRRRPEQAGRRPPAAEQRPARPWLADRPHPHQADHGKSGHPAGLPCGCPRSSATGVDRLVSEHRETPGTTCYSVAATASKHAGEDERAENDGRDHGDAQQAGRPCDGSPTDPGHPPGPLSRALVIAVVVPAGSSLRSAARACSVGSGKPSRLRRRTRVSRVVRPRRRRSRTSAWSQSRPVVRGVCFTLRPWTNRNCSKPSPPWSAPVS